MKKNLISIIILALLIVNIVLTAIMMFSVTGTNQKTATLVGDISSALALDLTGPADEVEVKEEVGIADTVPYKIENPLTITLKATEDGKPRYFVTSVSFAMNSKHKDYKKYGEKISEKEDLIKNVIYEVLGTYTMDELRADNNEEASAEILSRVQQLYDSDFIFKVNFIDFVYQ